MSLYEPDLARVQALAFSDFATRAAPAIVDRLRRRGRAIRRVVDIGCGAGMTTRALVDAGFETIAIEPSRALLELARAVAPAATFIHASIHDVEVPACDAVLAIGEPLTYHAPEIDADRAMRRVLSKVASALPDGGLFVFDVIVAGSESLDARGFRSGDDWAILYETREQSRERRLTREIETFVRERDKNGYRRSKELHHVRVFAEDELSDWLRAAGFEVETAASYADAQLPPRRRAFFATRRER